MNQERRNIMQITRLRMRQELEQTLASSGLQADFQGSVFDLLLKQMQKLSVRGPWLCAVYAYLEAEIKTKNLGLPLPDSMIVDAQLPLLLEGVICVQYYENQILDGKGGVLKSGQPDLQKIRSNLLASHYLKDFLYQYAAKSVFAHDGSRREVLVDALRKMFQFVDMGQYMEQRWGRYEVFRDGLHEALPEMSQEVVAFWDQALISEFQARIMAAGVPAFKDKFLRCYLQRAYLTNAALFVLAAELLMDLLGYQGPSRAALKRYAGHFGLMAQLSNDINDFLPASFGQKTLAKDAEDAQGDLRNGNMTLPMILHFSEYPGDTPTQLLQMPQKKIALRLKNAIWHKAVPLVKELAQELGQGLSPENPRTSLLQDFGSIALGGRYLDDFKKLFEDT